MNNILPNGYVLLTAALVKLSFDNALYVYEAEDGVGAVKFALQLCERYGMGWWIIIGIIGVSSAIFTLIRSANIIQGILTFFWSIILCMGVSRSGITAIACTATEVLTDSHLKYCKYAQLGITLLTAIVYAILYMATPVHKKRPYDHDF